jgi:hypothetical protein
MRRDQETFLDGGGISLMAFPQGKMSMDLPKERMLMDLPKGRMLMDLP